MNLLEIRALKDSQSIQKYVAELQVAIAFIYLIPQISAQIYANSKVFTFDLEARDIQ